MPLHESGWKAGDSPAWGAASAVWKSAFGNSSDWLGLGVGYMQPTAAGSKPEYTTEVFCRTQLTPKLLGQWEGAFNTSLLPNWRRENNPIWSGNCVPKIRGNTVQLTFLASIKAKDQD